MLYIHSFSPIEKQLFAKLSTFEEVHQMDCKSILHKNGVYSNDHSASNKTLLYSFQLFDDYQHIRAFKRERDWVNSIIEFAKENDFEKLILLTYPGAYFNASNLFLQQKGYLEQKFVASGITCLLLSVQGIRDIDSNQHNLHSLFYNDHHHAYLIPKNKKGILYSVTLHHLAHLIHKGVHSELEGKYDVFDTISNLSSFLLFSSSIVNIQELAPAYLYLKSYLGKYIAPAMLEIFHTATIHMYNHRTSKDFGISLESKVANSTPIFKPNPITYHNTLPSMMSSLVVIE